MFIERPATTTPALPTVGGRGMYSIVYIRTHNCPLNRVNAILNTECYTDVFFIQMSFN